MKRSHTIAAVGCYAITIGFLLFALFGRAVEQRIRWP